jgi:hypothetical protein
MGSSLQQSEEGEQLTYALREADEAANKEIDKAELRRHSSLGGGGTAHEKSTERRFGLEGSSGSPFLGRGLKGRSEVRWWDKLGRWRPSMDRRRLSSSRGCYRQERKRRWREYAGARCWWLMEGEGRSGGGWGGGSAAGHGGDGGGRR